MKGKTGKTPAMGMGKIHQYNAEGSQAGDEAKDETPEFKSGGATKKKHKDGGHVKGKMPKKRLDRKPRASGGRNPFSSAESVSGGAAEDEGGKRDVDGAGAETELSVYKGGGKVKK